MPVVASAAQAVDAAPAEHVEQALAPVPVAAESSAAVETVSEVVASAPDVVETAEPAATTTVPDSVESSEVAATQVVTEAEVVEAASATEAMAAAEVVAPAVEQASAVTAASEPAQEAAATTAAVASEAAPERAPSAPITLPTQQGDSGLIKIETDPSKLAQFGSGAVEPPARLGRKPRPAPVIVEEPLQQVETQK